MARAGHSAASGKNSSMFLYPLWPRPTFTRQGTLFHSLKPLLLLASEMVDQAPGSEVVANRLAEVLFIQAIRAHVVSGADCRNHGWLRAIFDPQIGAALKAIHENVNHPWTVESLAEAARMSRSAFALRFKELLGQAPLEYTTEWRMQKAVQLLQQRDKKLFEIAKSVGYDSDAAFSKAFKRVLGSTPGGYRRGSIQQPPTPL